MLLAAGWFISGAATHSTMAANSGVRLGVYKWAGNPGGVQEFGVWVGRQPQIAIDFLDQATWEHIANPVWYLDQWAGSPYEVVWAIPIIPRTGGTLAEGASGAYNHHFRSLAELMVSKGVAHSTLRLGWEFNGTWYSWSAVNQPNAFIGYWRQIVTTMRSVPGANFKFDWNVSAGGSFAAEVAYPGDDVVDRVALDVYNNSWIPNYTDPQARWQDIYNGYRGLAFWAQFARAHGKRLSIPEWGTGTRPDGHGGGDDTNFIQKMYDFMVTENVDYAGYWDVNASDFQAQLSPPTNFPNSAVLFKALFGGSLRLTTAASRKTHSGIGGLDVVLPLTGNAGVECRSGGAGGNHTLIFAFDRELVSGVAAVTGGTGTLAGGPILSGNTMTLNFTGVADAQTLTVTLQDVTDVVSRVMPDTAIVIGFLFGDSSADRIVNSGDAQQTRNRSGQAIGAANFRSDFNLDGTINSGDATVVRSRSGQSIP